MANRYWVGGTASWDGTVGTKWSATSGGAGGASVPTSADDVFFDANSGTGTVTIATGNTGAKSINCTGFTGTITGTTAISVAGSVTLSSTMTWSYTGNLSITGAGTIISAGKTFSSVTINAPSLTVSLGDAFSQTSSAALTITTGTFDTANYSMAIGQISSTGSATRTINLGSSAISLNLNNGNAINLNTAGTGLTFNAGTSTITIRGSSSPAITAAPGTTLYNVIYDSATTTNVTPLVITNRTTFNNLTIVAPSSGLNGPRRVQFNNNCTFNGGIFTSGTTFSRRVLFQTVARGCAVTLTINGAYDITNAHFSDINVIGTSAPLTGSLVGDCKNNSGIVFDSPKTVYWTGVNQNWESTSWALTSGGVPADTNFPLPQDTVVFDDSYQSGSTITFLFGSHIGTIDASARTLPTSFSINDVTLYGDLILGPGVTTTINSTTFTFSGLGTQRLITNGVRWNGNFTLSSPGGRLLLGSALSLGAAKTLSVASGEFNTLGYDLSLDAINTNFATYRSIILNNSTVSLEGLAPSFAATSGVLNFDAGSSLIKFTAATNTSPNFGNLKYNDIEIAENASAGRTYAISGTDWSCKNLKIFAPKTGSTSYDSHIVTISGNFSVTGTFSVESLYDNPGFRVGFESTIIGTQRTITVNAFVGNNIDFADIDIEGAAAPISGNSFGDCGNNTGINFPAPKTVYWNLAGSNVNFALGWATTSGGTPSIDNFPLAQDTAIWNDAGSANSIIFSTNTWKLPSLDFSARTAGMTFTIGGVNGQLYGDVKLSSAVTYNFGTSIIEYRKRGTSTFTSNGTTTNIALTVNCSSVGKLQLADAYTSTGNFFLTTGEFDAVTYNVTVPVFSAGGSASRTLRMGSGTWTITSAGTGWSVTNSVNLIPGTSNIVLSNNTTTARTFNGAGLAYNKLTIGGNTSTSTLTISSANYFSEIASTKTVAHTVTSTSTQRINTWSITGSAGNLVTVGFAILLTGACVSGVDYLNFTSAMDTASAAEFYAGVNSTSTVGFTAPLYNTTKPADAIRYWVGGTGNWSNTARWSASSGGAGGASVPRSHDAVIFNSASSGASYTATIDAAVRVKSLTIAAPASGVITLAGSSNLFIHGSMTLPAAGISRTFSGNIFFAGATTGNTINTNGIALGSTLTFIGENAEWLLGGAITTNIAFVFERGTFRTQNFPLTAPFLNLTPQLYGASAKIYLGSSAVNLTATSNNVVANNLSSRFIFDAGTSTITISGSSSSFSSANALTFANLDYTNSGASAHTFPTTPLTCNNLTFYSRTSVSFTEIRLQSNITINGTLTIQAGANQTCRHFIRSIAPETPITMTVNAVSLTDVDFQGITVTGAAAPISGTRLGDCKGNSGITFPAAKTVYANPSEASVTIGSDIWALTAGGATSLANFPLAQDTIIINNTSTVTTYTIDMNFPYNFGTINMSGKTTGAATITGTSTGSFNLYGNFSLGSAVTMSHTGTITVSGRTNQTMTTAGKSLSVKIDVNSPGGTLTLQDALTTSFNDGAITLTRGTLNTNNFNVTLTGASSSLFSASNSLTKNLNIGSSVITITGTGGWTLRSYDTVSGTGTIQMNAVSAATFTGGGLDYSGITLDNSGAGTTTIADNNIFKDITNSYATTGATTLNLGTTITRVVDFTGAGQSTRPMSLNGTSTSYAVIVKTGTSRVTGIDYLNFNNVQVLPEYGTWENGATASSTWYVGANSTATATEGLVLTAAPSYSPGVGGGFFSFP